MRGAVYKRGSTWTWHFDIDPDPLTGRRRQRTKGGYKTKKAAEQAWLRRSANGDRSAPPALHPHSATSSRKNGCRRSSRDRAPPPGPTGRTYIAAYVVPVLGQVKLQVLTLVQLNHRMPSAGAWPPQDDQRRPNRAGAKDGSQRARDAAQRLARRDALGVSGPPSAADPPAAHFEQRVWSPQEGAFLDHVRDDRLYALWLLVATTGMRAASELAGLRWVDIDFDHATVSPTIPRVVDHQVHDSAPKTERSRRRVALDPVYSCATGPAQAPGRGPSDGGRTLPRPRLRLRLAGRPPSTP